MLLILGIPWICESIHFFIHRDYTHCHPDSFIELVFGFFGTLNYCRGIFLFMCFVCKKTVLVKLREVSGVRGIVRVFTRGGQSSEEEFQNRSGRKGTFRTDLSR